MFARFKHPYLLLTLTTLFWSGNMVLGRAIREDVPPLSLAFWRWAIALALTLPLALPHLRAQWPLLKRAWVAVVVLGLLGVGGFNTLAYIALQYTAATNAVLLNSFIPILILLFGALFFGQKLVPAQVFGLALSFAGVLAIILHAKFAEGAWVIVLLIPILATVAGLIGRFYRQVARALHGVA